MTKTLRKNLEKIQSDTPPCPHLTTHMSPLATSLVLYLYQSYLVLHESEIEMIREIGERSNRRREELNLFPIV
jgi:hypothetical protein